MHFSQYQKKAIRFAEYPNAGVDVNYPVVGLVGEAGEVAGAWKKILRGDNNKDGQLGEKIIDELGDTLWYISEIANCLGISLDEIAKRNIRKLQDRKDRGVIKGSGDNR